MLNFQAQLLEFSLLVLYGILFFPSSTLHVSFSACYIQQFHIPLNDIFSFLMFSWPLVEQKLREKRENGTGCFVVIFAKVFALGVEVKKSSTFKRRSRLFAGGSKIKFSWAVHKRRYDFWTPSRCSFYILIHEGSFWRTSKKIYLPNFPPNSQNRFT